MLTVQCFLHCRNIAEMHDLDDKNKCERSLQSAQAAVCTAANKEHGLTACALAKCAL